MSKSEFQKNTVTLHARSGNAKSPLCLRISMSHAVESGVVDVVFVPSARPSEYFMQAV